MYDTRVIPIGAAGTGAKAWTLPGGFQIAGIKIDNKSGSWLLLPDGTFVPPYTITFGHSFQPMLASIDVLFSNGPAGQVTTQQGDSPIVTIYSEPVGESPGAPSGQGTAFVEQFTPVITAATTFTATTALITTVLLTGVANKRFRILTTSVALGFTTGVSGLIEPIGAAAYEAPVGYSIDGAGPPIQDIVMGRIDAENPIDTRLFPGGADIAIGSNLQIKTKVAWPATSIAIGVVVTALLI